MDKMLKRSNDQAQNILYFQEKSRPEINSVNWGKGAGLTTVSATFLIVEINKKCPSL